MKPSNDTALSPIVCTLLLLALTVVFVSPVVAENVTYPQEYYDLKSGSDNEVSTVISDMAEGGFSNNWWGPKLQLALFYETRRQTTLMEKQNELLAEQNELMSRLVNATEIKFVCTSTGYVAEPKSWALDEPTVSPSFNVSNYEYNTEAYK
jgi:hypothetical protein